MRRDSAVNAFFNGLLGLIAFFTERQRRIVFYIAPWRPSAQPVGSYQGSTHIEILLLAAQVQIHLGSRRQQVQPAMDVSDVADRPAVDLQQAVARLHAGCIKRRPFRQPIDDPIPTRWREPGHPS